jgi:hypothetical protein
VRTQALFLSNFGTMDHYVAALAEYLLLIVLNDFVRCCRLYNYTAIWDTRHYMMVRLQTTQPEGKFRRCRETCMACIVGHEYKMRLSLAVRSSAHGTACCPENWCSSDCMRHRLSPLYAQLVGSYCVCCCLMLAFSDLSHCGALSVRLLTWSLFLDWQRWDGAPRSGSFR